VTAAAPLPARTVILRLLGFVRPFSGQALLSILCGAAAIACGTGLIATAAYLISAAALAISLSQVRLYAVRVFGTPQEREYYVR